MHSNVPIFVINLSRDTEKHRHMRSLASKHHLEFSFIEAVYGKELDKKTLDKVYDENLSKEALGRGLSLSEIGCALSHLKIYQKMIDDNIEKALIFEDDVELSIDLKKILNAANNYPENWEIFLLGYYSKTATERISYSSFLDKKKVTGDYQAVRLVELAFGAHGYLINLRGAKKMVSMLNKIVLPLDHYTGSDSYTNMYALKPRVVSLKQKYKCMSSIDGDRNKIFKSISYSPSDLKSQLIAFKRYIGQTSIVYWLKILPSRFHKPRKYK